MPAPGHVCGSYTGGDVEESWPGVEPRQVVGPECQGGLSTGFLGGNIAGL